MDCYVLTGGRSARMGQSKADLFLSRLTAVATPVFDRVVAVERPDGEMRSLPTIFESPHDGDGPIFGVARSLADAIERCFILAVDLPLLSTAVLRDLRDRFEHSSAEMLVPMWDGAPQVLCAGYSTKVLPLVERRIASGRLSLRRLLDDADVQLIDERVLRAAFPGEPLMNVNTPADLIAAEKIK